MAADKFVPGDSLSRSVNLVNNGTANFSSLNLTSTSTGDVNALTNGAANGLKLSVKSCSVPWTKPTTTTYACTGGTTKALVTDAAAVSSTTLPTPASLTSGGTDYLVVTLALPAAAGNEFQGLKSSLALTFGGTQADGTTR